MVVGVRFVHGFENACRSLKRIESMLSTFISQTLITLIGRSLKRIERVMECYTIEGITICKRGRSLKRIESDVVLGIDRFVDSPEG